MKPLIAVPATLALVYRAWSRNSLTPLGIVVAAATAVAHAVHPWSVFFTLLVVFFLAGTAVTKVKHDVKAGLTHSSSGSPGGEGPRTHIQVLANSLVASVLMILYIWTSSKHLSRFGAGECWERGAKYHREDVLVAGIVANYAAVAADTFSSELGILSSSPPRLITAPWRTVPKGTNGGVTAFGLLAGLLGSFLIALTSAVLMPFCEQPNPKLVLIATGSTGWSTSSRINFVLAMTILGFCGSLLDSLLGALLQASVVDVRTGKIIEGDGGKKVPVHSAGSFHMKQRAKVRSKVISHEQGSEGVAKSSGTEGPAGDRDSASLRSTIGEKAGNSGEDIDETHQGESRRVESGQDILSNNGVNFVMALTISVIAIVGTCRAWDVPFTEFMSDLVS